MKKIIISLAVIGVVSAIVIGGTVAYYSDTETSTGNTFTAGSIELKVDSESHYNGMVCTKNGNGDVYQWHPSGNPNAFGLPVGFPVQGTECDGTWTETDLKDGVHTFFNFDDLKPGDHGENTISLHVYDNDAWGQFVITPTRDADNTCTDPEVEAELAMDPFRTCGTDEDGEIDDYLLFTGWLDQGMIPGFQNVDSDGNVIDNNDELVDPLEGNNIYDGPEWEGLPFWDKENIGNLSHELSEVLSAAYGFYCKGEPSASSDGDNDYNICHGLAEDGRMVGSTTYYFGLAWDFPLESGNDAQTDEYTADLTFKVEQHRNNPNPF